MNVFARGELRTIEDAKFAVAATKTRMRLMATALADALAEARQNQPGACDRIVRILEPVRDTHLQLLREEPR